MGGALVVVLSVSDDRGKAFTDQSLRYVTGERKREITLIKIVTRESPWLHTEFTMRWLNEKKIST